MAVMLTLAVVLLAALLAFMIFVSLRAKGATSTVEEKVDGFNSQVKSINDNLQDVQKINQGIDKMNTNLENLNKNLIR